MNAGQIFNILNIILYSLAGLWGIILLFRNVSVAWKWIALGAILWALTSMFLALPFTNNIYVFHKHLTGLLVLFQSITIGLCLFLGMLNAHTR